MSESQYTLYILRCSDGSLYTGIAKDVRRRLAEHDGSGGRGAKYLRGRGPLELVFECELGERGEAQRVEHALKRLSKDKKEGVVSRAPAAAELLSMLGLQPAGDEGSSGGAMA